MFNPFASSEDVEGDVQDMVGFVIGQMPLEQDEVGVDIFDQPGMASQQEHGADASGAEALDAISQFVVDIAGGHHRYFEFGSWPILDPFEDSASAFVKDSAVAFSGLPTVAFSGPLEIV